jgi:hypothetical protein
MREARTSPITDSAFHRVSPDPGRSHGSARSARWSGDDDAMASYWFHAEKVAFELGGRTMTIETGRMAKQAAGSALVTFGETMVLAAA